MSQPQPGPWSPPQQWGPPPGWQQPPPYGPPQGYRPIARSNGYATAGLIVAVVGVAVKIALTLAFGKVGWPVALFGAAACWCGVKGQRFAPQVGGNGARIATAALVLGIIEIIGGIAG